MGTSSRAQQPIERGKGAAPAPVPLLFAELCASLWPKGGDQVARNGYLWFLDRGNGGAIKFVEG
jgi:hypothetical protein